MRFVIFFSNPSWWLTFVSQTFPHSLSRLEQSETDSGCHIQEDSEELVTDLQARLAEMESELLVLREGTRC